VAQAPAGDRLPGQIRAVRGEGLLPHTSTSCFGLDEDLDVVANSTLPDQAGGSWLAVGTRSKENCSTEVLHERERPS